MVSEEQNNDMELASEVVPVPQVQPEIQAPEVDGNNRQTNNGPRGKPRHRKKTLYAAILKQMEFYFSDSNLTKDRFLGDLVKKDPNVDVDIFLRFNRIRTLATDKNKIVKALRDSKMLKISEDGTKVYRTTPIVEKQNIDECTVYVQGLPADADHEWLTNLFSEYGPVAYVSIPKFKTNHKIKGFAFIEFETPQGAEKCLKAFRKKGFELPSQTSPTDVLSITTFEEEKDENGSTDISDNKNMQTEGIVDPEKSKNKKKKRKMNTDGFETDQSDASKPKKKIYGESKDKDLSVTASDTEVDEKRGKKRKSKVSTEEVVTEDSDSQKNVKESSKKRKKDKIEEIQPESCDQDEIDKEKEEEETVECTNDEETSEKKKKRKRKRKHNSSNEISGPVDKGLQVMGKKEWKKLRNKYLDLQRSRMKQLKQHMRKARWNQWGERNKMEYEQEEVTTEKKENTSSGLEFTPGVIVKVELNEACVDPRGFKAELKNSCSNIKYIDVKEGLNEAFVRCDSSETATTLAQRMDENKSFKVLDGEEEKCYWYKIIKDREEKLGGKVHVKQRGRNKLLKKAEKVLGIHIKFEEV